MTESDNTPLTPPTLPTPPASFPWSNRPDESTDRPDESTDQPLVETVDRRKSRKWTERPRRTVLYMLVAMICIELSGVLVSIPVQVGLTAVAAFASVNLAIFGYRINRTAGVVMAAVFTSRMVALTLPALTISLPTRTGIVAVATIAVAYVASWVLTYDVNSGRSDEGFLLQKPFVNRRLTALLTMLSGFPIGVLAYFVLEPNQLVIQPMFGTAAVAWVLAVFMLVLGSIGEELIYRRLVAAMVQHTGRSQAPWPSAVLYGAAFVGTQNPLMIALAFVTGLLWSWSCERTGKLEPVVVAHIIATILTFILLPQL